MVDPEVDRIVGEGVCRRVVRHYHCQECSEHVDEQREVEEPLHIKDETKRDDKLCRVTKVERPVPRICKLYELPVSHISPEKSYGHEDHYEALYVLTLILESVEYKERNEYSEIKEESVPAPRQDR